MTQLMHIRRVACIALSTVAMLVTTPAPAHADLQDALAKGCDYQGYVQKFNQIAETTGWLSVLTNPQGWGGIGTIDFITAAATTVAGTAEKAQANGQVKAMLAQFESACQHWATARNVERQMNLVRVANRGIEQALTFAKIDTRIETVKVDGNLAIKAESAYAAAPSNNADPTGMDAVLDSAALQALRSSADASTMLETNIKALEALKLDLSDYASYNAGTKKHACADTSVKIPSPLPENYPTVPGRGPVCGPVTPGRAQQILAAATVINAQNAAILGGLHSSSTALRAASAVKDTRQMQKRSNARDLGWSSVNSAF